MTSPRTRMALLRRRGQLNNPIRAVGVVGAFTSLVIGLDTPTLLTFASCVGRGGVTLMVKLGG